LDKCS